MKKNIVIALLLMFCVGESFAQRYRWSVVGGYGITGNNFRSPKYKAPFGEIQYTIATDKLNSVFLRMGVGYLETQGSSSTFSQTGQGVFIQTENRNIGASFAISYNWLKNSTFFHRFDTYLGTRVGITLVKKITYTSTNPQQPLVTTPILPSPILYYSGFLGTSYQYNFTRAFGIILGGELEQSVFTPFKNFSLYQLRGFGGFCYNFS
ncbi:MAG: hypothetical protein ACKVTZ_02045 [Bacteroidia bacterium]